jgi:NAD(P)-dependent dehydrogenase (short-subunit alcohol dehydrogenase family)
METMIKKRIAVVVGGTDGIGREIAFNLALSWCQVVIIGRDIEKAVKVQREIQEQTKNRDIDFLCANLSSMKETDRLCSLIINRYPQIHYLVLSAGTILHRHEITAEGVEKNFAINYLSRFLILQRMLPTLERSGTRTFSSRILVINGAITNGKIYYNDVNLTHNFTIARFVSQQCRANDLLVLELAERIARSGQKGVTVNSYKLGVVKTNIRKNFPWWMYLVVVLILDPIIGMSPAEATQPALHLLLANEYEGITGGLFKMVRTFRRINTPTSTCSSIEQQRIWDLSGNMISKIIKGHDYVDAN